VNLLVSLYCDPEVRSGENTCGSHTRSIPTL